MRRQTAIAALASLVLAGAVQARGLDKAKVEDVLPARLQQSVAAVLDPGTPAARLMLIETEHDVQGSRILWLGDEYRDGWKLASVGDGQAVLKRGGRTLRVGLNAGWPAQIEAPSPDQLAFAAPAAVLSLSNVQPPAADRQTGVSRAIANAQPGQVYQMGGTPRQIAQAMVRTSPQLNSLLADNRVVFNVNVDSTGTGLTATRDGQLIGRFASPQLNMAAPGLSNLANFR